MHITYEEIIIINEIKARNFAIQYNSKLGGNHGQHIFIVPQYTCIMMHTSYISHYYYSMYGAINTENILP